MGEVHSHQLVLDEIHRVDAAGAAGHGDLSGAERRERFEGALDLGRGGVPRQGRRRLAVEGQRERAGGAPAGQRHALHVEVGERRRAIPDEHAERAERHREVQRGARDFRLERESRRVEEERDRRRRRGEIDAETHVELRLRGHAQLCGALDVDDAGHARQQARHGASGQAREPRQVEVHRQIEVDSRLEADVEA